MLGAVGAGPTDREGQATGPRGEDTADRAVRARPWVEAPLLCWVGGQRGQPGMEREGQRHGVLLIVGMILASCSTGSHCRVPRSGVTGCDGSCVLC